MFKILQLLLISVLVFSYSDGVKETIETMSLNQNVTTQQRTFYKNINEKFYDYDADVTKKGLSTKEKIGESHITPPGYILKWINYADTWDEFKANYGNLNLSINLELAFNWYNVVWSNSSGLSIPLNNITANENWIEIVNYKKMHEEFIGFFNFMTYAKISYAILVDEIYLKIRFKLETKRDDSSLSTGFIDYDNYYFTIDTRYVRCNSTFDYNSIYALLNENVNNKTLSLESDTSTSLLDKNNIPITKLALDQLIESALESHYQQWKNFISDYIYSDISNQAIITIKFDDPNTNEPIRWDFKVTIKFKLSQDYWNKNFEERLKIFPGKVIDPNNPNGAMVEDKPFLWEDKSVYSTTATIRFDGAKDGSETMKVNGIPIQVIDNTFTYKMTDKQEKDSEGKAINEYEVLIEKHDLNDFNKIISSFKLKYLIKQNVPNLDLKWYAWDPDKPGNEDQKSLITPNLPDGSPNPNYDQEVNSKTGTKKQIIWVKHKAQNPFPLDPLNRNGDIIKNNDYEEGFIAEGSVSGMGITQNFKDSWIKTVQRREVNPKTLQPIGNLETVKANKDSYFSLSGTYLYIITDQKGHTANKFITIGQQWKEKYAKFLDVLNNPDIAMPFWSTIHGLHLKNYLVKYKYLNSTNIQNLTFEQVVSYWKEYVSDIKSQRAGPDDKPKNNFNLSEVKFETIKMNKSSVDEIRKEIINQIQERLNRTDLIYDVDYELKPFDDASLKKLLLYDSKGSATINLTIIALDTSTRLIGTNTIKIINNINYDSTKVIDLKKINFETQRFDFNNFTVNKLIEWILLDINQTFTYYKINLNYPYDYGVKPFDRAVLQQFLTSTKTVRLVFTIYAQDSSLKTKNSTTLELVNDPSALVAPDKPPKLKPNPIIPNPSNNEKSWFSKKSNLFFMSIIAIFIVITLGTFILFKYRFKRGIGFKKNKKK